MIEVFQTLESSEGIWKIPAPVSSDLRENFTEQRKPSLALEALEVGGPENLGGEDSGGQSQTLLCNLPIQ